MKATHGVWAMIAVFALAGCPQESESEETEPKEDTTTTAAATTPAVTTASSAKTTDLKPETAKKPPIVARIKAEVDGGKEPDAGYSGTTINVAGTKGAFVAPSAWNTVAQSSTSADQKAGFTAMSAGDNPGDKTNLDAAAAALGMSDCEWGAAQAVTMGKDKVAATVADGVCVRGGTIPVRTGYAAIAGDDYKLLAMGRWDDAGGDATGTFNTFRSLKKAVSGTGQPGGIAACCRIIKQNMASAPPNQQGAYAMALGACQAAAASGATVPSAAFAQYCK